MSTSATPTVAPVRRSGLALLVAVLWLGQDSARAQVDPPPAAPERQADDDDGEGDDGDEGSNQNAPPLGFGDLGMEDPADRHADPDDPQPSFDGLPGSDGPWYLIPTLTAAPGARIVDAIGAGRAVYALDSQGILYVSHDYGQSFAARELSISVQGLARIPLPGSEIPPLWWGLTSAGKINFVGGMGLYLILGAREQLRWNISDSFSFPYGTTGEPYLELSPDSPAFNGGIWVPGVPRPGNWSFYDRRTRANASYYGAHRLLSRTGSSGARAHAVTVDLGDPNRVAVASAHGISVSRDGGLTFDPLRSSPPFSCCESLVFAGDKLVGSTERVLVLKSNGIGDPLLPGAVVPQLEWIVRDKGDPEHLLFVAEQELLESQDGGSTVRRVLMARASRINHVAVDATTGRIYVATQNNLFVRDPGEPEFRDTGIDGPVHAIEINPINPREVLLTRFRALQRSTDGGKTFSQFLELDASPVAMLDPVPGRGWIIVTERGAYRLSRTPPKRIDPAKVAVARYLLQKQPTGSEAMEAAYRRYVPVPPDRAWFDQLLPRAHFMAGVMVGPQLALLNYIPLTGTSAATDTRAPDTIGNTVAFGNNATMSRARTPVEPFAVAVLSWDLPGAVGPPVHSRREREQAAQFNHVQAEISRLHSLRTRLLVERIVRPPADPASVLDLELRIEEMTAQLTGLTGASYSVPDFAKEVDRAIALQLDKTHPDRRHDDDGPAGRVLVGRAGESASR